jgi:Bacterial type II and III secretion system protein
MRTSWILIPTFPGSNPICPASHNGLSPVVSGIRGSVDVPEGWRSRERSLPRKMRTLMCAISPSGRRTPGAIFVCRRDSRRIIRIRCAATFIAAVPANIGRMIGNKAKRCGRRCSRSRSSTGARRPCRNMPSPVNSSSGPWRGRVACSSAHRSKRSSSNRSISGRGPNGYVSHSGIPLFDQLPTIGNVVGNTGHNITRTELIIFIRPQVIRDSVDAHYVAEELRTKLKGTLAPVPPYVGPAPRAR